MISQLVTLAGVLIGAVTSFLATSAAERARHRRAMATRWDERKLDTYLQYATCVKEISANAKRARQAAAAGSEERQGYLAAMEEAELRRSAMFETLILLASPEAVEAADAVNRELWREEVATRDPEADFPGGALGLIELMNVYHERARVDLGIAAGGITLPAE